jgi:osmotically-inducible protein OsmY
VAAAKTVPGIVAVRDELRVNPNLPNVQQQVGDATLAGRIAAAIFAQTGSTQVRVNVRDGVVTLRGSVADAKTRTAAIDTARNTSGVKAVIDQMSS